MKPSSTSLCVFFLLAALVASSQAAEPAPLRTELTLTHVAADKWRADYVFAEAVTSLELGDVIGKYRSEAWRPLTPGVEVIAAGGKERLRSAAPLKRLSVEITSFNGLAEGQYAPMNRFTDGGAEFYLGFLYGDLMQGKRERRMQVDLHLQGRGAETVVAPGKPGPDLSGYAYFGPGKPVPMGKVSVIVDPQAPAWVREVIEQTTTKVSDYYGQAFQRPLIDTPVVTIALVDLEGSPGSMSFNGGAIGGRIAYRLQGAGVMGDHPRKREVVAGLVAHEMAHLWQNNLARGGIGEDDPWIHEGGAEAIALAGLRATGIYSEEVSRQYSQKLLKECEQLKNDVTSYRGFYACGFKRFNGYAIAPVPLWRALMERSESSGNTYSEPMIRAVLSASSPAAR